jgi:hypothetical protein
MIAVSKLCCPACWWFFNILRHGSDTFKLRGRHATVYTVDLPPWIPDIVLQQMMTEFRKRLSHELILMMNKMAEPKPERSSMESDSCLSTASNESGTNAAHPRRRTKWISIVRRN